MRLIGKRPSGLTPQLCNQCEAMARNHPGGATDITVLGDAPNTAARLSSSAAAGEILISDGAFEATQLDDQNMEQRELTLKGKSEVVGVRVLTEY